MINYNLVKPNDLWYVIGLITSDGNLSSDGRHIHITSKDKDLLESVKLSLILENKIGLKSRGGDNLEYCSYLQFGDIKFYKFLLGIGLTPKKSLILDSVKVPREYFIDFLRGVIDGDGCIHKWTNRVNGYEQWALRIYSGAPKFSIWLKTKTESFFKVRGKIYCYNQRNSKNPIHIIKFGKLASKIILNKIYYPNCLALHRKMLIVRKCLDTKNGFKNYNNVV
jgi:hypothetical protein